MYKTIPYIKVKLTPIELDKAHARQPKAVLKCEACGEETTNELPSNVFQRNKPCARYLTTNSTRLPMCMWESKQS
jgi:hypothetical protein